MAAYPIFYRVHNSAANPQLRHPYGHVSGPLHDKLHLPGAVAPSHNVAQAHADESMNQAPWDPNNRAFRDNLWDHVAGNHSIFISITSSWLVAAHMSARHEMENKDESRQANVQVSVINGSLLTRPSLNVLDVSNMIARVHQHWIEDGHDAAAVERIANLARTDREYFVHSYIPNSVLRDVPAAYLWGTFPKIFIPSFMMGGHLAPAQSVFEYISSVQYISRLKPKLADNLNKYAAQHPQWETELWTDAQAFARAVLQIPQHQTNTALVQHIAMQILTYGRNLMGTSASNAALVSEV